jgi:hypothetical protein
MRSPLYRQDYGIIPPICEGIAVEPSPPLQRLPNPLLVLIISWLPRPRPHRNCLFDAAASRREPVREYHGARRIELLSVRIMPP